MLERQPKRTSSSYHHEDVDGEALATLVVNKIEVL